jgi:hypothetical protein
LSALFCTPPAFAQSSNQERPLQEVFRTDLVYSQDKGEFQFTTGSSFAWNHGARFFQTPTQAEYGLTDSWQLQVEWDGWQRKSQSGLPSTNGSGDLAVGTKYAFMNIRGSQFHAAVAIDLLIPLGNVDQDLGEGLLIIQPSFILARDFPGFHRAQIFTQSGVAFVHRVKHHADPLDDQPAAHRLILNAGAIFPLHHFILTSELSWQTDRWNHSGVNNELYLTPGAVWKLPARWECAAGISAGLTPQSDPIALLLKFTKEFQLRKNSDL